MYPTINLQIETFKNATSSLTLSLMADLIPFFIIILIIAGTLLGSDAIGSRNKGLRGI